MSCGADLHSDAEYEAAIGRRPAFPLRLLVSHPGLNWNTKGYKPGRVVLLSYNPVTEEDWLRAGLDAFGTPDDVLAVKLFLNSTVPEVQEPHPRFAERLALLRDIAPRCHAIIDGNMNCEMEFVWHMLHDSNEERARTIIGCAEWTKRYGGVIRDLGGRPAIGLSDFMILMSAYWSPTHFGECPLLKAIIDLQVLVICFLGWKFWSNDERMIEPLNWDPDEHYLPKHLLDRAPWPKCCRWLRQVEAWGGVDYVQGLKWGNDIKMAQRGFQAGVIGQLPFGPDPGPH